MNNDKKAWHIILVFFLTLACSAPARGEITAGSVIPLTDGLTASDYQVRAGNMLYRAWASSAAPITGNQSLRFQRSLDGGATWEAERILRQPSDGGSGGIGMAASGPWVLIVERIRGSYYPVLDTACSSPLFWLSTDYGARFTARFIWSRPDIGGITGPSCVQPPKTAINQQDGTMYAAYLSCRVNGSGRCLDRSFDKYPVIHLAKWEVGSDYPEWVAASQLDNGGDTNQAHELLDLLPANPGVYLLWKDKDGNRFVRYLN